MGMAVVSIDRAVGADGDSPLVAGGTTTTDARSTPTFLSTESLTFPGVSLVSLGLVQIYNRATGSTASPLVILMMAGTLGALLIVWGLLGTTNARTGLADVVGQVIIGALNTILLYGVMLGVAGG
jgi:hypothetical protein